MAKQEMTPESQGSRPKVLMLAFACEPDFGSEPEVGWRWALEMRRYVDVTVVTDEGHRVAIEKKLPAGSQISFLRSRSGGLTAFPLLRLPRILPEMDARRPAADRAAAQE